MPTLERRAPPYVVVSVLCALLFACGARAQVPDFLQVGARLTWQGGNSTLSGARVVPEPEGPLTRNGQRYRLEGTRGGGGVGLIQLNVLSAGQDGIVADVRYLLAGGPQLDRYTLTGLDVVVGSVQGLGDYWLPPARLAAMPAGVTGNTTVWRGSGSFGNQTLQVVTIATSAAGSYSSATYDAGSGLLLFSGSMNTQDGTRVADAQGVLTDFAGAVVYSHQAFVGARLVAVPWAADGPPPWAAAGRTLNYQGQVGLHNDPTLGLPDLPGQAAAVTQTIDRLIGTAAVGRQVTRSYTGQGVPPLDTTANRAFGSAQFDGIWASPSALARLQPQQVLDRDPYSGQVVYFGGVTGGYGLVVTQGQTDALEQYYDMQSGALTYTRGRAAVEGLGEQVTELQLVGGQ